MHEYPAYSRPNSKVFNDNYHQNVSTFQFGTSYFDQSNNQHQENWCETCDRAFKTPQLLQNHQSEHQICGIDGCKFVAHPAVVTKHIQMQHSTGLYERIRNLESPEDIANWIKERKKNYPSKQNVEKKKAQLAECIDRGEKIVEKKSRFNKRQNNDNNNKFKNRRNQQFKSRRYCKKPVNENEGFKLPETNSENKLNTKKNKESSKTAEHLPKTNVANKLSINDEDESYCNVRPFKGISDIVRNDVVNKEISSDESDNLDIEDDTWDDVESTDKSNDVSVCKALSNLISAYASSDEENVDNKPTIITKDTGNTDDEDSAPEETNIKRSDDIADSIAESLQNVDTSVKEIARKRTRKRKLSSDNPSDLKTDKSSSSTNKKHPPNNFERQLQYYKERPSTLLEKLLQKDIRHERNVLLQCINYIVKNNFFDK